MWQSLAQSAEGSPRLGVEKKKKETTAANIMACPRYRKGGHKKQTE